MPEQDPLIRNVAESTRDRLPDEYGHSRSTYRLAPGDPLLFDGEGAHGPTELTELPIRFLSIIAFPDGTS